MRSRSTDVFINCPFDGEFAPMFRALVFGVTACGFRVRCALEVQDSGETRIDKLYNIIEKSRYGIHDLSRTELDATNNLPRFNMPLELGMFLGAKRYGDPEQKAKRCVVFDIEQYRYQKFISDIAGADIQSHGGDPATAVERVRNFLSSHSRRKTIPSPAAIIDSFGRFEIALPELTESLGLNLAAIQYPDLERMVREWVKSDPSAA